MKAVLLAAGKGSRLTPITNEVSKQMIPIAGKPLLEYIIKDIVLMGFDEICIITGHLGHQIKEYFQDGSEFNARIQYITQKELLGTADAVYYSREFVGDSSFLLYLSDTLVPGLHNYLKNMLATKSEVDILSSSVSTFEITKVGNIETNNGYVRKLSEKSSKSKSNLAWAGITLFKNNYIFEMIKKLNPSFRDEYEITEAMNLLLQNDKKIKNHICDQFIDAGTKQGMIHALKTIFNQTEQLFQKYSKNQKFRIKEPAYIGKNCSIGSESVIGPFASIGDGVTIGNNVSVTQSIILNGAEVKSNTIIKNSIISQNYQI